MSDRDRSGVELTITVPDELLTLLANRIAAHIPTAAPAPAAASPWLGAAAAAAYIGIPRNQLYKLTAANAIPVHRKRRGQGLRFRREELDAWLHAEYEATGWTPRVELSSSTDT